jgi:hypothetical protein
LRTAASINISGACRFDYQVAADLFPESDKTNLISRASLAVNPIILFLPS